jgi:hypothetical protein
MRRSDEEALPVGKRRRRRRTNAGTSRPTGTKRKRRPENRPKNAKKEKIRWILSPYFGRFYPRLTVILLCRIYVNPRGMPDTKEEEGTKRKAEDTAGGHRRSRLLIRIVARTTKIGYICPRNFNLLFYIS